MPVNASGRTRPSLIKAMEGGGRDEHHLHAAAEQRGHDLGRAPVGDVLQLDSGLLGEDLGGQVQTVADARRAIGDDFPSWPGRGSPPAS